MRLISVIICTHNRAGLLFEALDSLTEQGVDRDLFSVIVVDNNSSDNTRDIVRNFENVLDIKYCFEKKQGLSHARNRGVAESVARYLAFLDDDARVASDWIEKAILMIETKKPDIFGGPIYPVYENKKPKWFLDQYETLRYGSEKKELRNKQKLFGSNIFIKKNLFDKIGPFNIDLGMKGKEIKLGEEIDFQNRARGKGVTTWYDPALMVYHLVAREKLCIKYILRRAYSFGRTSRAVYPSLNIGLSRDMYYLIRETIKIFFFFALLVFRNKNEYPCWQNYFLKYTIPISERVGRIKSYFN